jgi:hypothetical protein
VSYDDSYSTCARTYASLRIFSLSIAPDEISATLGVAATSVQHKGPVANAQGQSGMRPHGWVLSSDGRVVSKDARRHLDWVLDQLAGRRDLLASLASRGARADVVCTWFSASVHAGPTLSPQQCRKLAELELECWFDFYPKP